MGGSPYLRPSSWFHRKPTGHSKLRQYWSWFTKSHSIKIINKKVETILYILFSCFSNIFEVASFSLWAKYFQGVWQWKGLETPQQGFWWGAWWGPGHNRQVKIYILQPWGWGGVGGLNWNPDIHTHIPLQGFNNKNLRFGCSDIGAAVQDLFLRLEAFCDKSWVQRADSLQVSRNTKDQKMSAAGIGGFLISNNILINDDDSNYRVFFTLGIP